MLVRDKALQNRFCGENLQFIAIKTTPKNSRIPWTYDDIIVYKKAVALLNDLSGHNWFDLRLSA